MKYTGVMQLNAIKNVESSWLDLAAWLGPGPYPSTQSDVSEPARKFLIF